MGVSLGVGYPQTGIAWEFKGNAGWHLANDSIHIVLQSSADPGPGRLVDSPAWNQDPPTAALV